MATFAEHGSRSRPGGAPYQYPLVVLATLGLLALLGLQAASYGLTFVGDDWRVLDEWRLTPGSLLTPYNEHLSAIPIAVMLILRDTVGTGAHLAFLLPVHALHVATVAGVFLIARRRVGDWPAVGMAVLLLLLGSGAANLFWAWQVGAIASVAAGTWAIVVLDRRTSGAAVACAVLLAVALASSSFGLAFTMPVAALAIRRSRPALLAVVTLLLLYGTWSLWYVPATAGLCRADSTLVEFVRTPPFGIAAVWYAGGALLGVTLIPVVGAVAGSAAGTGWMILLAGRARRHDITLAVGCLLGIIVLGVLVSIARGCLGPQVLGASRYVYVTGMLMAIGLVATVDADVVAAVRRRPVLTAVVLVVFALAVALNVRALAIGRDRFVAETNVVDAAVGILLADDARRCDTSPTMVDALTSAIALLPRPDRVRALVRRYGDPRADVWQAEPRRPPPSDVAAAERVMCRQPAGRRRPRSHPETGLPAV